MIKWWYNIRVVKDSYLEWTTVKQLKGNGNNNG